MKRKIRNEKPGIIELESENHYEDLSAKEKARCDTEVESYGLGRPSTFTVDCTQAIAKHLRSLSTPERKKCLGTEPRARLKKEMKDCKLHQQERHCSPTMLGAQSEARVLGKNFPDAIARDWIAKIDELRSLQPQRFREAAASRVITTIRYCERRTHNEKIQIKWTTSSVLHSVSTDRSIQQEPFLYNLRRGGTVKVYPNLVGPLKLTSIQDELLSCGLFRQYQLQAQDEPRLHFLLHDKATNDDFETSLQPGYSYANVWVKARPLSKLHLLEDLSRELASTSGVEGWNIGVHPVLYRNDNDSMGEHADDDQGEQVILCLIVSSPPKARRVIITPKAKGERLENGDERVELTLSPGDAYEMDGEMQKHYFHAVPKRKVIECCDNIPRISIVFRTGNEIFQRQDSGRPCRDLSPKLRPTQIFGDRIEGLFEGHVYSRRQLFEMNAHRMQQRGISGKIATGADALIVSGLRQDKLGSDNFLQLVYAVESNKGGLSVLTSFRKALPIRVFRSSTYEGAYRAASNDHTKAGLKTLYRYDGLYKVVHCRDPIAPKRPYIFELHRLEAGPNENSNTVENKDILDVCTHLGTANVTDSDKTVQITPALLCRNVCDKYIHPGSPNLKESVDIVDNAGQCIHRENVEDTIGHPGERRSSDAEPAALGLLLLLKSREPIRSLGFISSPYPEQNCCRNEFKVS